jgi:hypothetical protein
MAKLAVMLVTRNVLPQIKWNMKVCTIFLAKNMLYTVIEYSCAEFTTNRFHSVKIVKESTICEQSQPNSNTMQCCCIIGLLPSNCALCLWQFTCVLYFLGLLLTKSYITFKDVWGETRIIRIEFLDAFWFKIFIYLTSFDCQTAAVFNLLNGCSMTMCIPWNLLPLTVVPIEVFLKYWFNTLPQADQFISSSSSRYSYTSCERSNSKNLIISGRFLSI